MTDTGMTGGIRLPCSSQNGGKMLLVPPSSAGIEGTRPVLVEIQALVARRPSVHHAGQS